MRRPAALFGFALAVLGTAPASAQPVPPLPAHDPRIACGTIFAATTTADPTTVVMRIVNFIEPVDGTIKAYGRDTVWTAQISRAGTTNRVNPGTPFKDSQREDSVRVRAPGTIEAIEFDPSWTTCAFRAGVREPNGGDAVDDNRPTVVASNGAAVEPTSCATPYVEPVLTHAVIPEAPAVASQVGISGIVRVKVALDPSGAVTFTRIWSSPSALLNAAATAGAKASTYRGAVFRCQPVPSGYEFVTEFRSVLSENRPVSRFAWVR